MKTLQSQIRSQIYMCPMIKDVNNAFMVTRMTVLKNSYDPASKLVSGSLDFLLYAGRYIQCGFMGVPVEDMSHEILVSYGELIY